MQPDWQSTWEGLPYAWGGSCGTGLLRSTASDFQVIEIPVTEPEGHGEHNWLYIRKTAANTEWVARQLAKHAAVAVSAVSYAGLKDRHAITEQWFSLHLPGKSEPDWSAIEIEGVDILKSERHTRKLKRGALKANRFVIRIRSLSADRNTLEARLTAIRRGGVPNYFGAQRFGRDGMNLAHATDLFTGKRRKLPRHKRGLYLSAARSALFNRLLAKRVTDNIWCSLLPGDVLQLDNRSACFVSEENAPDLPARVEKMHVHLTGPMWGRGALMTERQARAYETAVLNDYNLFREGLEQAGLKQERRSLRLVARELAWDWQSDGSLILQFMLSPGGFATSVLREICQCESAA